MDDEDWSRERAISMSATTEVGQPASRSTGAEAAPRKSILAALMRKP
jgi:hypothetical protein